jgi:hypothetical protein
MRARAWSAAAAALLVGGLAAAEPKPKAVEIKAYRDKLIVLQDASGGTYVVMGEHGSDAHLFYGPGKTLYEQIVIGRSSNEDAWDVHVLAPRMERARNGSVAYKEDHTYSLFCGMNETGLTRITGDKAKQILDKSAFMTSALVHRAHALARDDHGVYYYVDTIRDEYGGKGFRLFIGRKGAMKQIPLIDIATDTDGQVFATKSGELRIVAKKTDDSNDSAFWSRGEKRDQLVDLDTVVNSPLIFNELGIYSFTGTICDAPPS